MPDGTLLSATFIGAALDRGAPVTGSSAAPAVMRRRLPVARLRAEGVDAEWLTAACEAHPSANYAARLRDVGAVCAQLADGVESAVRRGRRFIAIGGDHSCAIGTWSGARRALGPTAKLGLVWVDAHMDSHIPTTSPSHAIHGMPLAVLLGHGEPSLTALSGPTSALQHPDRITQLGIRSFEPEEAELLSRIGVRIYSAEDARRDAAWTDALARAANGADGFGVTVDLDAFDPTHAMGVNTPIPGGLDPDAVVDFVARAARHPRFLGVEIVELNPSRDPDGKTAALAERLARAALAR